MTPEPNQTVLTAVESKVAPAPWLRPELVASWPEIILVLLLTQGFFIYGSARLAYLRISGHLLDLRLTNYSAAHHVAIESTIVSFLLLYLHWRGWRPGDLKISIGWRSSLRGLILAGTVIAVLMIGRFVTLILFGVPHSLHPTGVLHYPLHATHLSILALVVAQIINALIEEITCICYAFNQFAAKNGPGVALLLMLVLRASYHTYKTPSTFIILLVGFSLYGLLYWRFRNVWPLILGHFLYDMLVDINELR